MWSTLNRGKRREGKIYGVLKHWSYFFKEIQLSTSKLPLKSVYVRLQTTARLKIYPGYILVLIGFAQLTLALGFFKIIK